MVNKRGFVYFIEIIFTILIVLIIVVGFIGSKQEVFNYRQRVDLREEGWSVLNNLDETDTLAALDSSELRDYIRESLNPTTGFEIEYYNGTQCYNISASGDLGTGADSCTRINTTTEQDIVSVFYTVANGSKGDSYRLYLWRKL
jgi:hypothetical protein